MNFAAYSNKLVHKKMLMISLMIGFSMLIEDANGRGADGESGDDGGGGGGDGVKIF